MAANDNIRVLEAGMKKARELAGQMLFGKAIAPAEEVVHAGESSVAWTGFTGNAETSFGAQVSTKAKVWQYRADNENPPVVMQKVEKGDEVRLEEPYEGGPRAVVGEVDIRYSTSTVGIDAMFMLPFQVGSLVTARIVWPVEYMNYLREHYAAGKDNPMYIMHDLAPLAFKTMR